MRLRNVKNKEEIMNSSDCLIRDPENYKGKWHELFGNSNPIYVEIGMGKGKFIVENALNNPNINFIGIEKYDSVIVKGIQKIEHKIPNLFMVRADAYNICDIFDHEIDLVYLNFSDPWPKNRHQERRLSSPTFLKKYDSIFTSLKSIEMRTDNKDLFTYSLISFSNNGYKFEDISLDLHNDDLPLVTTEYEDKFSKNGMPIYYIKCFKD